MKYVLLLIVALIPICLFSQKRALQKAKFTEKGIYSYYTAKFKRIQKAEDINKWCSANGFIAFHYEKKQQQRFAKVHEGIYIAQYRSRYNQEQINLENERLRKIQEEQRRQKELETAVKIGSGAVAGAVIIDSWLEKRRERRAARRRSHSSSPSYGSYQSEDNSRKDKESKIQERHAKDFEKKVSRCMKEMNNDLRDSRTSGYSILDRKCPCIVFEDDSFLGTNFQLVSDRNGKWWYNVGAWFSSDQGPFPSRVEALRAGCEQFAKR